MILLIIVCILLLALSGFLFFLLNKAIKITKLYEAFYKSTIDDVDAVIESLEELMYRRQLLSDDPDVRKTYKTISILRDILAGYSDAFNRQFVRTDSDSKENEQ